MRINRLRFKNLNSLRDEFTIDFDGESVLGQAGIFAITGPIGAGKTTILDAVCVALYGQTPRLDAGDSNELMTRHTGDCFAEVEFSVRDRHFRAKWSQRRARNKPDGRFQPTAMELTSLEGLSEKIIEEQKSKVPARVTELTGLDFSRFCRSIMLAQGNFAAFLNAKDNERADLLEKMTGTEIYSLISRETFVKSKEEEEKLKELKLVIENIALMGPEELEKKSKRAAEIAAKIKIENGLIKQLDEVKKGLLTIQQLEKAIQNSQRELETIAMERESKSGELERLAFGLKALPLKGEFDVLMERRKQNAGHEQEIAKLNILIPDLVAKQKKQETRKELEEQAFKTFLRKAGEKEILIAKTIQKDQQISDKKTAQGDQQKDLKRAENVLGNFQKSKKEIENKITLTSLEIVQCRLFLEQQEFDASLEKKLPLIKERVAAIVKKASEQDQKGKRLIKRRQEAEKAAKRAGQVEKELEKSRKKIQIQTGKKDRLEKQIAERLVDRTLDDWEEVAKQIEKQQVERDKLLDLGRGIAEIQATMEMEQEKLKTTAEKSVAEQKRHAGLVELQKTEESLLEQLEQKKAHELLMAKYQDDRKKLVAGEPCPLCGSEEHPYFDGIDLEVDKTAEALSQQKEKIVRNRKLLKKIDAAIVKLTTVKEHAGIALREHGEKIQAAIQKWREISIGINIKLAPEAWESLKELQRDAEAEISQKRKNIGEIKRLKIMMEKLNEDLHKAKEDSSQLKLDFQEAANRKKQIEEECLRLRQEFETVSNDTKDLANALAEELKPYRETVPDSGREIELLDRLEKRGHTYRETGRKREKLEKELAPLREKESGLQGRIKTSVERLQEENKKKESIKRELEILTGERKSILGNQSTDQARSDLDKQRTTMETQIKNTETELGQTKSDLNAKQELLKNHQTEHRELASSIQQAQIKFGDRLKTNGFIDETEFQKVLLPPEEHAQLEKLEKQFTTRNTQAKTRLEDAGKQLEKEIEKKLTKEDLEKIREKEQEQRIQQEVLQQELGGIRESLRRQEQLEKEQKEQLERIRLQEKEFKRWDALNQLIGAHDGKKFRRFAQGLTLDYLISLANTNLEKLNDRYYLQRNKIEELGLEVVDTYQADVTRPTSTLSGGEAFLASLALALGLSSLAARNATIDSLFLDEGFGTLDTEALEVALAALDSLNAAGKTIGIISHVEALKERIPTQVQVRKLSGGVSTLEIVT